MSLFCVPLRLSHFLGAASDYHNPCHPSNPAVMVQRSQSQTQCNHFLKHFKPRIRAWILKRLSPVRHAHVTWPVVEGAWVQPVTRQRTQTKNIYSLPGITYPVYHGSSVPQSQLTSVHRQRNRYIAIPLCVLIRKKIRITVFKMLRIRCPPLLREQTHKWNNIPSVTADMMTSSVLSDLHFRRSRPLKSTDD